MAIGIINKCTGTVAARGPTYPFCYFAVWIKGKLQYIMFWINGTDLDLAWGGNL